MQYQYGDTPAWSPLPYPASPEWLSSSHCPAHIGHLDCLFTVEGFRRSVLGFCLSSASENVDSGVVHVCFAHECTPFFALDHRLLFKSTARTRKARDCVRVQPPLLIILLPLLSHNHQVGTICYLYLVVLHPNFYMVNMYKGLQYC